MIAASVFRHAEDNEPKPVEVAGWEELVREIGTHRIDPGGSKFAQPALSPAEYPPGAPRSRSNVRRVHFALLDFDKLTAAQLDEALACTSGLACLLYTTWSHPERHEADGSWSFRLILPLTRPVEAVEWPRFFPRLCARFRNLPDEKCSDASRIYFAPSSPVADGNVIDTQEGAPIDVEAVLADPAPGPKIEAGKKVNADDLASLAKSMRRRKGSAKDTGKALALAVAGRAFAEPGSRDETMFRLACAIAEAWPSVDADSVGAALAPAVAAMQATAPDCPGVDVLVDKVRRAQGRLAEERDRLAQERRDAVRAMIVDAFGGARSEPYTEDELSRFAQEAGCTRGVFQRRWIIQLGRSFYLFKAGAYLSPVPWDSLVTRAERELAPASSAGVTVWKADTKGNPRPKTIQELMLEYGTVADRAIADLSASRSTFEPATGTLREAPCPLRDLEPERSPSVEAWLAAFAGDRIEQLLDWIAAVTWLDQPCAALYVDAPKGAGKSMLAQGLARLWTDEGPVMLEDVAGSFNDAMVRCPLVFGDEVLPDVLKRTEGTGYLRQFIQARRHTLRRKYLPTATLVGSVRLLLAANNMHMLDTREALTPADVEAIAERVLYLRGSTDASRLLAGMGRDGWRAMVEGDGIARHALWLRQQRQVDRNRRFIVGGEQAELHRALSTGQGLSSAVCHWCVGYLLEPGRMDNGAPLLARTLRGRLLVTTRALSAHWEMYPTNTRPPPSRSIQRALSAIAEPRTVQLNGPGGRRTDYWHVTTEHLLQWAADNAYCTADELLGALQSDTQVPGMPDPGEDAAGDPPF